MAKASHMALGALAIAVIALVLTLADALAERSGDWLPDIAIDFLERFLLIGTAVTASVLVHRLGRMRARADDLALALERAAREGQAWRAQSRRLVAGLGDAIESQFAAWGLTPAEADVAGLLLKGASLREIAVLRRTSEATIRQQAQCVYRKSGLSSRAELSAFFLEDLFSIAEVNITVPGRASAQRPDA